MKNRFNKILRWSIGALLGTLPIMAETVDFVSTIHPILPKRCAGCHGSANPQAGLSLTSRNAMLKGGITGPAVVPGRSAESLLIKRAPERLRQ